MIETSQIAKSANVNTAGRLLKDVEDDDYIYKVPCNPRDTISLRDSKPIVYDHKKEKKYTKDIQLVDLSPTAAGGTFVAQNPLNIQKDSLIYDFARSPQAQKKFTENNSQERRGSQ
jgi:hypothetical protein